MPGRIGTWLAAAAGALVAAAMVYLAVQVFLLPNARQEGRKTERAATNENTLNAVKDRVKDDATREAMDPYDLCVNYFRNRGRVPECEQLRMRSVQEEQP